MRQKEGRLIVLDGNDGSGKQTQTQLLKDQLGGKGKKVQSLDFPGYYRNVFGKLIGEMQTKKTWLTMEPRVVSTIYAGDRLESNEIIKDWLKQGHLVILDRFVSANQIHQGGKIKNPTKRQEFLSWLDTMEHETLGIVRPDLVIYLDVSVDVSLENLAKNKKRLYTKGKLDVTEGNRFYLENSKKSARYIAEKDTRWRIVDCMNGDVMHTKEIIHGKIMNLLREEKIIK